MVGWGGYYHFEKLFSPRTTYEFVHGSMGKNFTRAGFGDKQLTLSYSQIANSFVSRFWWQDAVAGVRPDIVVWFSSLLLFKVALRTHLQSTNLLWLVPALLPAACPPFRRWSSCVLSALKRMSSPSVLKTTSCSVQHCPCTLRYHLQDLCFSGGAEMNAAATAFIQWDREMHRELSFSVLMSLSSLVLSSPPLKL